jgi:antitoxin component YwqK of YwqJK toxin-antitoxin module
MSHAPSRARSVTRRPRAAAVCVAVLLSACASQPSPQAKPPAGGAPPSDADAPSDSQPRSAKPIAMEQAPPTCRNGLPACPAGSSAKAYAVDGGFNIRCETGTGTPDGGLAVCDTAGTLLAIVTIKGNVKHGPMTLYFPSGRKKMEREFVNDQPDGWTTEYYENGRVAVRAYYRDGEKDGLQTDYLENGVKRAEGEYRNGQQDGRATLFYASGKKEREGTFKDGKPDGSFTYWAEDGSILSVTVFRDGVKVSQ